MIRIPKKKTGPGDTHTRISTTCGMYLGCEDCGHEWFVPGSVARQKCPECGGHPSRMSMKSYGNRKGKADAS